MLTTYIIPEALSYHSLFEEDKCCNTLWYFCLLHYLTVVQRLQTCAWVSFVTAGLAKLDPVFSSSSSGRHSSSSSQVPRIPFVRCPSFVCLFCILVVQRYYTTTTTSTTSIQSMKSKTQTTQARNAKNASVCCSFLAVGQFCKMQKGLASLHFSKNYPTAGKL